MENCKTPQDLIIGNVNGTDSGSNVQTNINYITPPNDTGENNGFNEADNEVYNQDNTINQQSENTAEGADDSFTLDGDSYGLADSISIPNNSNTVSRVVAKVTLENLSRDSRILAFGALSCSLPDFIGFDAYCLIVKDNFNINDSVDATKFDGDEVFYFNGGYNGRTSRRVNLNNAFQVTDDNVVTYNIYILFNKQGGSTDGSVYDVTLNVFAI